MNTITRTCPRCKKRYHQALELRRAVPHAVCAGCGHRWPVKVAARWFVSHLPGGVFSKAFATYADAVGEAQSECQTDKRPKRISSGFYELHGTDRGVYLGTVEGFNIHGFEVR